MRRVHRTTPRALGSQDSLMNYNELEAELCEALTAAEWIASVRWDRNDTSIEWTPLSKANLADFEASVHQVLDYRSANRRAFLHEFAIYHRLTEPTRLESIKKKNCAR